MQKFLSTFISLYSAVLQPLFSQFDYILLVIIRPIMIVITTPVSRPKDPIPKVKYKKMQLAWMALIEFDGGVGTENIPLITVA